MDQLIQLCRIGHSGSEAQSSGIGIVEQAPRQKRAAIDEFRTPVPGSRSIQKNPVCPSEAVVAPVQYEGFHIADEIILRIVRILKRFQGVDRAESGEYIRIDVFIGAPVGNDKCLLGAKQNTALYISISKRIFLLLYLVAGSWSNFWYYTCFYPYLHYFEY